MKIQKLSDVDFTHIYNFIKPYEKYCVLLYSFVLQKNQAVYVLTGNFGEIHGIFSWFKKSTIHHCLPDIYGKNKQEIETAFIDFFKTENTKYIFCISGEKNGTEFLKTILQNNFQKKTSHIIENKLFENGRFDTKMNSFHSNKQITFSKAKLSEIDEIFLIQKEYEKEEVLISPYKFNPDVCYANLENFIEASCLFVGKIKNKILCKATISAIGENYVLLGGVYTIPQFRKHGLAKSLILFLWKTMEKSNKKITLFVKTTNFAAIKLYESCGLKPFCDYEILYF